LAKRFWLPRSSAITLPSLIVPDSASTRVRNGCRSRWSSLGVPDTVFSASVLRPLARFTVVFHVANSPAGVWS
jgi:hypothetical protein